MKLGRLVIAGCVVVGLLVAGCHQSDSSVAQKPTTPKAAPQPQTPTTVEAAPAATCGPGGCSGRPRSLPRSSCCGSITGLEPYKDKLGNVWAADQELDTGKTWARTTA